LDCQLHCDFYLRSGLLEKTVAQPLLNETNGIVAIMAASRISASNLNYKMKKNKKSNEPK